MNKTHSAATSLLLNCDLGEGFGAWQMGNDAAMMPLIDCANIACGMHAGDPSIMQTTVALAVAHDVQIGAHPGYPDLAGFGRRSLAMASSAITALVTYQVGALAAFCQAAGTQLAYVKPHGALYHDMLANDDIFAAILAAMQPLQQQGSVPLVMLAQAQPEKWQAMAAKVGVPLWFEGFADRAYQGNGHLVPRSLPGAVLHDPEQMLQQALQFAEQGSVTCIDGSQLTLKIDTLCVHGDTPEALTAVQKMRAHSLFAHPSKRVAL